MKYTLPILLITASLSTNTFAKTCQRNENVYFVEPKRGSSQNEWQKNPSDLNGPNHLQNFETACKVNYEAKEFPVSLTPSATTFPGTVNTCSPNYSMGDQYNSKESDIINFLTNEVEKNKKVIEDLNFQLKTKNLKHQAPTESTEKCVASSQKDHVTCNVSDGPSGYNDQFYPANKKCVASSQKDFVTCNVSEGPSGYTGQFYPTNIPPCFVQPEQEPLYQGSQDDLYGGAQSACEQTCKPDIAEKDNPENSMVFIYTEIPPHSLAHFKAGSATPCNAIIFKLDSKEIIKNNQGVLGENSRSRIDPCMLKKVG
ncbi:hypothetical protein MDAP_001948 [Mitosporidium daphniae]